MDFVDRALARRLESAEEIPQVRYAEIYKKAQSQVGAAVEPICGGHMIFAGVGSPIGRVTGAGFGESVAASDLDRIEQFYRSRKAASQVDVCPLTDSSLLDLLKARTYTLFEFNNVLFRRLDKDETFPPTRAAVIRPGREEEAVAFASIVERSFFPEGNSPYDVKGMLSPLFQMEDAITFVAEVEGQMAACGAGLVTRMAAGAKAGCEYAVIVTLGGTTSQRNAERLEFRVAYTKATMLKEFPPGS
jgi:hypothetical protein